MITISSGNNFCSIKLITRMWFYIVECVQSPAAFFAKRINDAIQGMGTDDSTLIRVIISRSEIDMETIKMEFERIYDRTLLSAIKVIW